MNEESSEQGKHELFGAIKMRLCRTDLVQYFSSIYQIPKYTPFFQLFLEPKNAEKILDVVKRYLLRVFGSKLSPSLRSQLRQTFMVRWEKISRLAMKVMVFHQFWYKTTYTEIWQNNKNRKLLKYQQPLI